MKLIIKTVLLVAGLSSAAQAQDRLTCVYRAAQPNGSVADVTVRFWQDAWGRPAGGSILVEPPGEVPVRIQIPASAIAQMFVGPGNDSELAANVHVRSYGVDLVLNYAGNEIMNDATGWMGTSRLSRRDLNIAYANMLASDAIFHRMRYGPPSTQLSGSVRAWDGRLLKYASSLIACTARL